MRAAQRALTEGRRHLPRVLEQLEAVRWQLIGIKLSLSEPSEELVRVEDVSDEMDALTELRTTIECVLNDGLRPALKDLRNALVSLEAKEE